MNSPGLRDSLFNSPSLDWIAPELAALQSAGLLRRRRVVEPLADGWCLAGGRRLRNFASNDYLNLAHDPRLAEACQRAARESGVGARASALVCGRTHWHAALEDRLARFEGQPAAIVFPTGYAANVGSIAALAGKGDCIFSDRLNHASLIDGCRLSRAAVRLYDHADLAGLERDLQQVIAFRRRLIVTDSVFSMDGDLAPLPELCALAERHQAMLLVDEAHATGVFGASGRGVAELMGVEGKVGVRVGTLSKAAGVQGGFVAGPQPLIDWLWNRARVQIFSTALSPALCAAASTAVELIEREPWRRERLLSLTAGFRERLAAVGVVVPRGAVGPIVPIVLHAPDRALRVAAQLEEAGYLVGAIRPPSIPAGTSRLRITLSCAHTADDVSQLAQILAAEIGIKA
ncbi:MAG: 8-amino-7-oxononanoate synthase [Planctomycetaceae bacterium]